MGQPLQWLREKDKKYAWLIGRGKKIKHLYLKGILPPVMASFTLIIMCIMWVSKAKVADHFAGVLRKMLGPWWGRGWSSVGWHWSAGGRGGATIRVVRGRRRASCGCVVAQSVHLRYPARRRGCNSWWQFRLSLFAGPRLAGRDQLLLLMLLSCLCFRRLSY